MDELSELAQRVLSELEEAWAENIASTMNTVLSATGREADVVDFQTSLRELLQNDLIEIAAEYNNVDKLRSLEKTRALVLLNDLGQKLCFHSDKRYWLWRNSESTIDKAPIPELVATQAGLAEARRILHERGYRWWKMKS